MHHEQSAIAEAAFMIGMERNSEVVQMASFAPLIVNVNVHITNKNNAIILNATRCVHFQL